MIKKEKKAKQTYEQFALRLMANEELDFKYNEILYSIVHNPPYVYLGYNVVFKNGEYKSEKFEKFTSIFELLEQATIDGKRIREIWNDIVI